MSQDDPLPILPPTRRPASRWGVGRRLLLQAYRLAVVAATVWLIRGHHVKLRIDADAPVTEEEVAPYFGKQAVQLHHDGSSRLGYWVRAADGTTIGYAVRTSPTCDDVIGYCGPTDLLIAFDPDWRILGVSIRRSWDTTSHVRDIKREKHFLRSWNGRTWAEVVDLDWKQSGIEGVSGATMTSTAIARSIQKRLRLGLPIDDPTPIQWRRRDLVLIAIVGVASLWMFSSWRRFPWLRAGLQLLIFVVVGLWLGDLLSQSLLVGWASQSFPWRDALGLTVLAGAAFVLPWTTRRNVYCQSICPMGLAQTWVGGIAPRRWQGLIHPEVIRGLRWMPVLLLMVVVLTAILGLPIDLADLEPFDAFLLTKSGIASLILAGLGLAATLFYPQAYCKLGCPTGALFEFVRSHGPADRLQRSDVAGGLLVLLIVGLIRYYDVIRQWLIFG